MTAKRIVVIGSLLAMAGCGREASLKPAPGRALPVKPLMARTTPTPEQLLTAPAYARPERVDELVKRSQPRQSDPFDLPPPAGGMAPSLPAGADPTSNQMGQSTPK
jgi:hypothetical protein